MQTQQAEWAIGLGVLGAILGSFIATLVVRWTEGRSVARGRSACDGCGKPLTAAELVPLVSWIVQRGRCRACGSGIGPVHPLVELVCAGVGASAGWVVPGFEGVVGAVFGWLLVALAALDLRAWWLPDRLTAPLALGGAIGGLWFEPPPLERLLGGALGFGLLWLVMQGYARLRGRAGMGGGDPKLFGGLGLWLGWRMLPPVLLAACLLGLGIILIRRLRGQDVTRTDALPFGALLAIAAYPAWLLMVALRP